MSDRRSISRSAFKVSLGSALALVAGMASQVAIAWLFGTGDEMDAFLTALVVPTYLQMVLLTGLSFVFIPAFLREEAAEHQEQAWALAGTMLYLVGGVLLAIAIVCACGARWIISLMAPGLDATEAALATQMLQVLAFTMPLYGLGSLSQGIENSRDRFFWPAFAPAIGSLANVIVLLVLYDRTGPLALAWGSLASVAFRALVTLVPVLRHGWSRLLPLNDTRVVGMLRLMTPFILFSVFTYSSRMLERFFASTLPVGSLSNLGYGEKLSSILVMVLGAGIATAIFPALARAHAAEGNQGLAGPTEFGLRLTFATALPAIAVVSVLAIPIVTILFQRGAFRPQDAVNVALVVPWILLSDVLCRMVGNVTGRAFYVLKDTITTPIVGACAAILYYFIAAYMSKQWGYIGLAAAMVVQMGLANVIILILLSRRLPQLFTLAVLKDAFLYAMASGAAALCAWGVASGLSGFPSIVQLAAGGILAVAVYFVLLTRFDSAMAVSLLEIAGLHSTVSRWGLNKYLSLSPASISREKYDDQPKQAI